MYKKISELKTREESEKDQKDNELKANEESEKEESEKEEESSIFGEGDDERYDDEMEEELQVDIVEKKNPCSDMVYDPNRVEFRYQYEDKGLIAVRKGICFKCSAYRMIIFTNVNDGYNSCQICERCIQGMLDDARNN